MYAKPTIHEFLDNPMGKGSNAIAGRAIVKNALENRYLALLERKQKLFTEKVYVDKNKEFYIHITIPSETERDNTYDVVIKLCKPEAGKELADNSRTLNDYIIEVFSNSPSFTYTYAFAFNQYEMLIPFLREKFHDVVLKDMPTTRNPSEVISYEKSITFAMFHILNKRLLLRSIIEDKASKFDEKDFSKDIRTDDTIKMEINKAKRKSDRKADEKKVSSMIASKRSENPKTRSATKSSSKIRTPKTAKKKTTAKAKR